LSIIIIISFYCSSSRRTLTSFHWTVLCRWRPWVRTPLRLR